MQTLDISADDLCEHLLSVSRDRRVSILDSCGVGHLGSHLMIAGVEPVDVFCLNGNADRSLSQLAKVLSHGSAVIFSLSYSLGRKLQLRDERADERIDDEPDIYAAAYDQLLIHDYNTGQTFVTGPKREHFKTESIAIQPRLNGERELEVRSNFSRDEYIAAIETIKEYIRRGDTYQTNLTQRLAIALPPDCAPQTIFQRLRRDHPAPFAAFLNRGDSFVVSASPERFLKMQDGTISASPIKGTRPRGNTKIDDDRLRNELLTSEKDRAENTMIVDLLRNDLGRVCEFGSVQVERLCEIEEHPTLFHLVSTISGKLRRGWNFTDVLRATFPCGSITGAPKMRTMEIIDELEPSPRELSMGAIGYYIPETGFEGLTPGFDLSVAIRTMVIREGIATFNVGGGITIDSNPAAEYDESLLKAKALLASVGNK